MKALLVNDLNEVSSKVDYPYNVLVVYPYKERYIVWIERKNNSL